MGVIGLVIIIIARTEVEPARGRRRGRAALVLHRHRPARLGAAPVGTDHLAAQANTLADAAFVDDAVQIVEDRGAVGDRSEEHTSELQSLMRNSYAVFCLNKKQTIRTTIKR